MSPEFKHLEAEKPIYRYSWLRAKWEQAWYVRLPSRLEEIRAMSILQRPNGEWHDRQTL